MANIDRLASTQTLEKLEYPAMVSLLAGHCQSESGKRLAQALLPSPDKDLVGRWQDETAEALRIKHTVFQIPLGGIVDVQRPVASLARGGSISIDEFLLMGRLLYASRRMKDFLEDPQKKFPVKALAPYAQALQPLPELEKALARIFDDEGQVQDKASDLLASIRRRIQKLQDGIKTQLDRMIRQSSMQTMLQEPLVSIRNGHYVIPIKAAYRQKVAGIVHDQSASGATLYIEPMAIVQSTQDLASLELEEEKEIQRILDELASQFAPHAQAIGRNWEALSQLDLIFAKASLSDALEGHRPDEDQAACLRFYRARHPLIAPQDVVPIDVQLGEDHDCLVITGPNTGGKTVTLKTLGLLVLMHQAGLQIPVAIGSSLGIFQAVYADIGDEQSIAQSLSTFSSHFVNINRILRQAQADSLILYDELGAGTDPDEGAALAVAILEHSMALGAKVVATTHYGELKHFAYDTPRVQNASVEFDVHSLRPTYRLMMGVSGNSNAFDISSRIGIDERIIQRARNYMEERRTESQRLLEDLEESQYAVDQERRILQRQLEDLRQREEDLKAQEAKLEASSDAIVQKAKDRAANILIEAKRDAEGVTRELKHLQKQGQQEAGQRAGAISRKLSDKAYQLRKDGRAHDSKQKKGLTAVDIGQTVHLDAFQQDAVVLSQPDKKGDFQVQAGIIKMAVNLKDVSEPSKKTSQPKGQRKASKGAKAKSPSLELDIRGHTVDEAMPLVDKFIDDAYLQGLPHVQIIHGKGTGVLRQMVQDLCRGSSLVASYRLGSPQEGGDGVTIAELK